MSLCVDVYVCMYVCVCSLRYEIKGLEGEISMNMMKVRVDVYTTRRRAATHTEISPFAKQRHIAHMHITHIHTHIHSQSQRLKRS